MHWMLLAALGLGLAAAAQGQDDRAGLLLEYALRGNLSDTSGNRQDAHIAGNPAGVAVTPEGLRCAGGGWLDTGTNLPGLADTFTIELRVKPAAKQRPYADILGNHENEFRGFAIQQEGSQTNRYYFTYGDGRSWFYTPLFALAPDRWQHLAIVKAADRARVYLDGLLVSTTPATRPLVPSKTPFLIGLGISGPDRTFAGEIADVRIWDRPRSFRSTLPAEQQVAIFAASGRIACEPSARWGLFRAGEGNTLRFSADPEAVPLAIGRIDLAMALQDDQGERRTLPAIELRRETGFAATLRLPNAPGYRKLTWRPSVEVADKRTGLVAGGLHYCLLQGEPTAAPRKEKTVPASAGSWTPSRVESLDGEWLLATDPKNEGRDQRWFDNARPGAVKTRVPWVIQDRFPGYHGVAWYWREVRSEAGAPGARRLLSFEAVDYLADVWVNGKHVGGHEGGETPFVLDVTDVLKPGAPNLIAVRVLNPTTTPIDGMTLANTPHRAKCLPYTAGGSHNHGGIVGSVALETVPPVWVEDLYAQPSPATGAVRIRLTLHNATAKPADLRADLSIAPAAIGDTIDAVTVRRRVKPGSTVVETELRVPNPRKWDLHDPFLYRVTARTVAGGLGQERSVRIGFRDFRLERGYFRLNGRRIYIRSSHTVNAMPVGLQVPFDPGLFRRDLVLMKTMGFNMIRFIWGGARPEQLEACDEIGIMAYVEHSASNPFQITPQMEERFDLSLGETIRQHRNHPSVAIWGLLNETPDGPYFRHAVSTLPLVRSLDPTRVVLLNSGRWDGQRDIGSVCNPGAAGWDGYLGGEGPVRSATGMSGPGGYTQQMGDVHAYPRVPHTAETVDWLATFGKEDHPIFLTEYGIGSAVDLWRLVRTFEQIGHPDAEDARFYRQKLDQFLADWERWKLAECFGEPQRFFAASLEKVAGQRTLGLNAIRANPNLLGHSVTGMMDHVDCGEGLFTLFRELKPGTTDAMAQAWAPLRLCLFAEPQNAYKGGKVHLKAVLANEDVLAPGDYPVRLTVYAPDMARVFDKTVNVTIKGARGSEPPFVIPFFADDVPIDGPAGTYRFTATMLKGGAPTGGEATFRLGDPAALPRADRDVALFGEDRDLAQWLTERGARVHPFDTTAPASALIVVTAAAPGDEGAWRLLKERVEAGATAVVLCPQALRKGEDSTGWLPLPTRGAVTSIYSWLYLKDEWSKAHPYFAGLPSGGLMDYAVYRDLIPDLAFVGLDAPDEAIAGAIKASQDYASGLMLSVHRLGAGRIVLNTFLVRENLGRLPAADRLLVNLVNGG